MSFQEIKIVRANGKMKDIWLEMRLKLWPNHTAKVHEQEIENILKKHNEVAFLAFSDHKPIGFVECSIRKTAEGCDTNNVGYIEGWFVDETLRRQGLGRKLIQVAEDWAKMRKCKEMASDCEYHNEISQKVHIALGYKETNRLIHFKKSLQ